MDLFFFDRWVESPASIWNCLFEVILIQALNLHESRHWIWHWILENISILSQKIVGVGDSRVGDHLKFSFWLIDKQTKHWSWCRLKSQTKINLKLSTFLVCVCVLISIYTSRVKFDRLMSTSSIWPKILFHSHSIFWNFITLY